MLILDNAESILQSGQPEGQYRPGYEGYGQLLRRIADESHQSCLLLTSRERPTGIALREGNKAAVRSLQLKGLSLSAAQRLLETEGIVASEELVEQYAGNPLALKIAAATIRSLFAGDVDIFLKKSTDAFDPVGKLLEQHFSRLSPLEQSVMYWLAITPPRTTLAEFWELLPKMPQRTLLAILESLQGRSLIETSPAGVVLQPSVRKYVVEQAVTDQ